MSPEPERNSATAISGLILAGGQARRMGGVDKALQLFLGRPLVERIIERFRPQVSELLLNPASGSEAYERFGCRLVTDEFRAPDGTRGGPLAGMHAGLGVCTHRLLATVPCDAPNVPADLVLRLHSALQATGAEVAVVRTGAYLQPVFALMRRELRAEILEFLQSGGRKIDFWFASRRCVEVPFDDEPDSFANLNTLEELRRLEAARVHESP